MQKGCPKMLEMPLSLSFHNKQKWDHSKRKSILIISKSNQDIKRNVGRSIGLDELWIRIYGPFVLYFVVCFVISITASSDLAAGLIFPQMSAKAKMTFLGSIIFTTTTIAAVFYMKDQDFINRRVGINRDIETRSRRRIENEYEQNRQLKLAEELNKKT